MVSFDLQGVLRNFLEVFYIVNPWKNMFENTEDVPDYNARVMPFFVLLLVVEALYTHFKKLPYYQLNDSISSLVNGSLAFVVMIVYQTMFVSVYVFIYNNYRLLTLPWDALSTWIFAFLVADCIYYWFHRLSHTVPFMWAVHLGHHSSMQYNLTTALRQSAFQVFTFEFCCYPAAFLVPPATLMVHKYLVLIFQYWIHTRVIKKLPSPIEFMFNTPSNHRVHHGGQKIYRGKNFGGVLMIWDKLFGTYQQEQDGNEPHYAWAGNERSFNPIWTQFSVMFSLGPEVMEVKSLKELSTVLLGYPAPASSKEDPIPTSPPFVPDAPIFKLYKYFHFFLALAYAGLLLASRHTVNALSLGQVVLMLLISGFLQQPYSLGLDVEVLRSFFVVAIDLTSEYHLLADQTPPMNNEKLGEVLTHVLFVCNLASFLFSLFWRLFKYTPPPPTTPTPVSPATKSQ